MPKPSLQEYGVAILLGPYCGIDPWTARSWPGVDDLSAEDRNAAIWATRRKTPIWDARLAPAVIGYGRAVRVTRDRFFRWHDAAIVGVFAFFAFVLFGPDWPRVSGLAAGLALSVVVFFVSGTRGLRRTLANAATAEATARCLVEDPSADDDWADYVFEQSRVTEID